MSLFFSLSLHRVHGMVHGCLLRWWLPSLVFWSITWPSLRRAPSKHKRIHNHYVTTGSLKTEFWWYSIYDPSSSVVACQIGFCPMVCFGTRSKSSSLCIFLFRLCLYTISLINLQMNCVVIFVFSIWMQL